MTLMQRRRALLMYPRNELNGFVDGNYTNGTSVFSIRNNIVTFDVIGIGVPDTAKLPLKKELSLSAGDTIRTRIDRITGSISGHFFCYLYLGQYDQDCLFVTNKLWATKSTAMDVEQELTNDISGSQILIKNSASERTGTDYSVRITIYRNGEQIFPEV